MATGGAASLPIMMNTRALIVFAVWLLTVLGLPVRAKET
jgi:hypothetical protein